MAGEWRGSHSGRHSLLPRQNVTGAREGSKLETLRRSFIGLSLFAVVASALPFQAFAKDREIVNFRRSEWKRVHFKDDAAAEAHYKTVKNLGCEAKKFKHGNHTDVSYRCVEWRSLTLKTHDEAMEWQEWLKTAGFETSHEH